MDRSESQWFGVTQSGTSETVFDSFIQHFFGKWVGMEHINGEFKDLSIDNNFDFIGALSELGWLGASCTNTRYSFYLTLRE
jgi:hypothetical protein